MKAKQRLEYDGNLLSIYIALLVVGLINLLSASAGGNIEGGFFWALSHPTSYVRSQFVFMFAGFVLMFLVARIDYRIFERMAYPIYIIGMLLLASVLIFGSSKSGSTRWVELGSFRLQPSEPCKLILIIVLAKFFHSDKRRLSHYGFIDLWLPLLIIGIPLYLLYLEPDLGTALFYLLVASSMILFAGMKPKSIMVFSLIGVGLGFVAYQFLLHDYQKGRILAFINPEFDPLGKGYHAIQSLIAVGSGKFFGKGYLAGSQSQLKFLPEQHTDFIFSVLAEEWGFIGSFLLLLIYFGLLITGLNIAGKAKEKFGTFVAFGISALFFWQIVVNLGGVLGLLPITGITLPFLSYGGSSILTLSIAVGLLQGISTRRYMF